MNGRPIVAVTGATGFLGLHLVATLARSGARLRILARRPPDHPSWTGLTFETVRGGLEDPDALAHLAAGAQVLVHAAGLIKAPDRNAFMAINRDGTARVASTLRRLAPQARLIVVSSLAAREPQLSDYAASKRAGEEAARQAYADAPGQLAVLRPPMIYGPWDRETLAIFRTASRPVVPLVSDGRLAAIHVSDAAGALSAVATGTGASYGGTYALADTEPAGYAMAEMMRQAALAMRGDARPRFLRVPGRLLLAAGQASSWWGRVRGIAPIFTVGKAREILHPDWTVTPGELLPASVYQPAVSLAQGFRDTVGWYRSAGWLP
ncbi:NAD-dependent epimerase/dehydratase family protein [Nitrospirillum viridazoti]|uniref:Epimerase n=1 Tax=Nitrospirillum viridazoti CBAmc TaxID=1441467 RepID=A0A248K112_9PROT|nr:SDR family NAD(P)-dependent oxidoreductase [Nitrospirillum amazonense]ASG24456.1 epimerase [Nitrospirillum amazonense CBAmc]TWB26076.1 nucleoside-diphosphate-sugar epimerase [Nitrospirillum amazonense]